MKLFFSGIKTVNHLLPELKRKPDVLVSYLENYKPDKKFVNSIFLDSGAFSVFNASASIKLHDYMNFCHENNYFFDYIAALDVIGNWRASKNNYIDMKKDGLDVIPTYHAGEPLHFLDWLLSNYKHIGIGGLVKYVSFTNRMRYDKPLMRLLIHAHNQAKKADVKLHGFGVTGWSLMSAFDWYSVDSTTYLAGRKFARPLYFEKGRLKGQRDYAKASNFSRKIGLNYSEEQLKPDNSIASSDEKYKPIDMHNIMTTFYAVDKVNEIWNKKKQLQ